MKILNLYAGLGSNRRNWSAEHEVTSVELRPEIAEQYAILYPDDQLVISDAHQYLVDHYKEYDFIWSSPPCQSHSVSAAKGHNQTPRYVDMKLWQEVLFLQHYAQSHWVVENVKSYYQPFIQPQAIGRHRLWANFHISAREQYTPLFEANREALVDYLGFDYQGNIYYDGNHDPLQILRNCVHPELGEDILNSATGKVEYEGQQQCLV